MKATARIRYLSAKVSAKTVLLINLSNLEFLSRIFHHIAPVHEEECCLHEVQYTPSNVKNNRQSNAKFGRGYYIGIIQGCLLIPFGRQNARPRNWS